MVDQIKNQVSVTEYEALPESRHPIQLIEGELFEFPMPNSRHQRISRQLMLLILHLRPDGEVLYAPLPVFLNDRNVFEPDVMWLAPESQAVVSPRGVEGVPELVVEILSPSTAHKDRGVKFLLYAEYGAREYWLIDPERSRLEVWKREGNEFVLLGTFSGNESFTSPLLERRVELTAIFPVLQ